MRILPNILENKPTIYSIYLRQFVQSFYNIVMNIQFTKMQGAGNDFMVVDAVNQTINLTAAQIQQLANR
jgi:hypothetical protein